MKKKELWEFVGVRIEFGSLLEPLKFFWTLTERRVRRKGGKGRGS